MNSTQFISNAHQHSKGKVCGKCNEHLPLSEFTKRRDRKDGLAWDCKSCNKEYKANKCPFKRWWDAKKGNSKYDGTEFTIEPEDIPGVKIKPIYFKTTWRANVGIKSWETIEYPKVCPVLGIELAWDQSGRMDNHINSPTLDRIDPTKGYIRGNVMMMSKLANQMKSNSTTEQLNQFCRYHLFGETA